MKRLIALAVISGLAGGASLALPTSNAVADPPRTVQLCKFLQERGVISNLGECVSYANEHAASFCQQHAPYWDESVGQCIHDIKTGGPD